MQLDVRKKGAWCASVLEQFGLRINGYVPAGTKPETEPPTREEKLRSVFAERGLIAGRNRNAIRVEEELCEVEEKELPGAHHFPFAPFKARTRLNLPEKSSRAEIAVEFESSGHYSVRICDCGTDIRLHGHIPHGRRERTENDINISAINALFKLRTVAAVTMRLYDHIVKELTRNGFSIEESPEYEKFIEKVCNGAAMEETFFTVKEKKL